MTLGIFFPSQRTGKQAAQGASSVATGPNALARQRFTHVGIIVRDLERVARTYADLLGVGLSPIRTVNLAFPGRKGDGRGRARIAYLRKRGVALKLIEPLGPSPLQDFVSRRGSAIHHIGFDVGSRLRDTIRWLERCGGRQVLGHADRGYAQIDLTRQLGLVVELGGTPN
jgi:catechol 2,3-dioxygenase-like lactoylglutathione lyase family enzyme